MKRKLQEANSTSKRLQEVLAKQKANKKAGKENNDRSGLAGAADRVRNFVHQVKGYLHYLSLCVASNRRQETGLRLILSRCTERHKKHCSCKYVAPQRICNVTR
jgi:hypothetical protein